MISQNAGFDSTDILNKLRQKHAAGGKYFGVDIMNDGICDTHETFVWEPSNIKQNAIVRDCQLIPSACFCRVATAILTLALLCVFCCVQSSAVEAACVILSVDETVRNPKSEEAGGPGGQQVRDYPG